LDKKDIESNHLKFLEDACQLNVQNVKNLIFNAFIFLILCTMTNFHNTFDHYSQLQTVLADAEPNNNKADCNPEIFFAHDDIFKRDLNTSFESS